jgi:hypothetical protein
LPRGVRPRFQFSDRGEAALFEPGRGLAVPCPYWVALKHAPTLFAMIVGMRREVRLKTQKPVRLDAIPSPSYNTRRSGTSKQVRGRKLFEPMTNL